MCLQHNREKVMDEIHRLAEKVLLTPAYEQLDLIQRRDFHDDAKKLVPFLIRLIAEQQGKINKLRMELMITRLESMPGVTIIRIQEELEKFLADIIAGDVREPAADTREPADQ